MIFVTSSLSVLFRNFLIPFGIKKKAYVVDIESLIPPHDQYHSNIDSFFVNLRLTNNGFMNAFGNIFWLLLGGIVIALIYYLVGLLMCVTIIGIPFGVQLFKLGTYALWPFGHELVDGPNEPGCLSVFMNLFWILTGWWEIAILHLVFGLLFCVTIIGIPFGVRHFKMAIASIFPFGKEIR